MWLDGCGEDDAVAGSQAATGTLQGRRPRACRFADRGRNKSRASGETTTVRPLQPQTGGRQVAPKVWPTRADPGLANLFRASRALQHHQIAAVACSTPAYEIVRSHCLLSVHRASWPVPLRTRAAEDPCSRSSLSSPVACFGALPAYCPANSCWPARCPEFARPSQRSA